jgi:hypothetical protein
MPLVRGHHTFDDHFTQVPNAWLRDTRLSFKARGLLAHILSHRSGWSLSIHSLAATSLEGRDAIRSAIQELERAGYLKRTQSNEAGRFGESVWTTCDPEPLTDLPMTENPTTENPTTKKNILLEEHQEEVLPQAELEEAFEKFWKIYPRKVEKLAAKRALASAMKREKLEVILAGALRYANDPNLSPNKQFIAHPTTWLNGGRWDDEPLPERELTKEEIQAKELEERKRKDEARRRAEEEQRRAMREAQEHARKNPPKLCIHDRVALICPVCSS